MTQMRFIFVDHGVSAVAELLTDMAPRTCAAITSALPQDGVCKHGTLSGSEVSLALDPPLEIPRENSATRVLPGEIAYFWMPPRELYGVDAAISQVTWFYDRNAQPRTPNGPAAVNVFAEFVEGLSAFVDVCAAMKTEGAKRIRIELVP